MNAIRVLIANEPRYYRDVIAAGLFALRPRAEVMVVEPDELAASAVRLHPEVIVCSRREDAVVSSPLTWVLFPLDDRNPVIVNIAGAETVVPSLEFDELVAVIDATARLTSGASPE